MVRPKKIKTVNFEPDVIYFKPRAVPLSQLCEVELTIEELETLRLYPPVNLPENISKSKRKNNRCSCQWKSYKDSGRQL